MEHPFEGSWGYQVSGYYAPTSRLGIARRVPRRSSTGSTPAGIGVILDWVPAHFPRDEFALARFDGTALYEHADPRRGAHPDWGTLVFNYGRARGAQLPRRQRALLAARVPRRRPARRRRRLDALPRLLARARRVGRRTRYGGNEDLRGDRVPARAERGRRHAACPARSSWRPRSRRPGRASRARRARAGSASGCKWNLGWMHDTLDYFHARPGPPRLPPQPLTFGLLYAYTENFLLPLSHDEVVHGKGSLLREDARRPLAAAREPARPLRLHVGPPGQEAPLHGRRARPGAGVERGAEPRLAPARRGRARRRPPARRRPEPPLPRRAGALGARLRPRRLPLARGERRRRERPRLRALLRRRPPAARRRLQLLRRQARGLPRRPAGRRGLARRS